MIINEGFLKNPF